MSATRPPHLPQKFPVESRNIGNNFYLAGMYGGPDIDPTVNESGRALRRALEQLDGFTYCPAIDAFGIMIYVAGAITEYEVSGPCKVRLEKRFRRIGGDIGLTREQWQDRSVEDVRATLARQTLLLFELFIKRLQKENFEVEEDLLRTHLWTVLDRYIEDAPSRLSEAAEKADRELHRGFVRVLELRRLALLLEEEPLPTGLPPGWSMRQDPDNPERIVFERNR